MDIRRISLGTVAYVVVTFPAAVVWHVLLFEEHYQAFGYFEGEPSFAIGFVTIVLQGGLLSTLFPLVKLGGGAMRRGLVFVLMVGLFFWTSHVLAFVAKQTVMDAPLFVVMETGYLAIQFGVYGLLLGFIHRDL